MSSATGRSSRRYGSGQFYKDLKEHFGNDHESVILSKIENKEGILAVDQGFPGEGKVSEVWHANI